MNEPFLAGTFSAEPVRIHAYHSRGVFMFVDANNSGCWTDPNGRVLLPTLDIVDRVLAKHGYVREEMAVKKLPLSAPTLEPEPSPEPVPPPEAQGDGMTDAQAQAKLDTAIKKDRAARRSKGRK
jgi:hypothetical protein